MECRPLVLMLTAAMAAAAAGCGGPSTPVTGALDESTRAAVADTIREVSTRMLDAMRARDPSEVLAFYGKDAAYVGNGAIGDWPAILAGAPPRYATYTRVDCVWDGPFRVDVLSRTAAVVTAVLDCQKADTSGQSWREVVARTEVLAIEDGRWRIVAVHESAPPGGGPLR